MGRRLLEGVTSQEEYDIGVSASAAFHAEKRAPVHGGLRGGRYLTQCQCRASSKSR